MFDCESEQVKLLRKMLEDQKKLIEVVKSLRQRSGGAQQGRPARSATIIPFVPRKMDKA